MSEMIVITNIDYIVTERDVHELAHYGLGCDRALPMFNDKGYPVEDEVVREVVRGRRFRSPNGNDVLVGMSVQAEGVIGIQYDAWGNLQDLVSALRGSVKNLDREIVAIKSAGFFTRLKWLFTGIKA